MSFFSNVPLHLLLYGSGGLCGFCYGVAWHKVQTEKEIHKKIYDNEERYEDSREILKYLQKNTFDTNMRMIQIEKKIGIFHESHLNSDYMKSDGHPAVVHSIGWVSSNLY